MRIRLCRFVMLVQDGQFLVKRGLFLQTEYSRSNATKRMVNNEGNQGPYSQNFLRQIIEIFVTLGRM